MHTLTTHHLSIYDSSGFSLIEVLISILVLSFGIFGAMKIQLLSIQASLQSNFYSTSIELISDIADRMRGNPYKLRLDNSNPFLNVHFQSSQNIPTAPEFCYTANCSTDQLAHADIAEWLQQVDALLPNARAVICRDSAPWDSNSNSLTWNCSSDENASIIIKLGWAEHNDADANPPPRIAIAVSSLN
jgi:type IV pilus assembly protein PilV